MKGFDARGAGKICAVRRKTDGPPTVGRLVRALACMLGLGLSALVAAACGAEGVSDELAGSAADGTEPVPFPADPGAAGATRADASSTSSSDAGGASSVDAASSGSVDAAVPKPDAAAPPGGACGVCDRDWTCNGFTDAWVTQGARCLNTRTTTALRCDGKFDQGSSYGVGTWSATPTVLTLRYPMLGGGTKVYDCL